MKLIKISAAYLMLLVPFIVKAEKIPAQKTRFAPVVNGKLNDEVWKTATPINKFVSMGTDTLANAKTEAKIVYTDTAIYFGFKCFFPNKQLLKSQKRDRDGRVYHDDCVEVMLDIANKKTNFYQIVVNPSNSVYDTLCDQGGYVSNPKWNGQIKTATYIGKNFWSCEIMVPYYTLEITPQVDSLWGINLCRETKNPIENSSIAKKGAFKTAGRFRTMSLQVDFSRFRWQMTRPIVATTIKNGKLNLRLNDIITNLTGKEQKIQADCLLIGPRKNIFTGSKTVNLKNNEKKSLSLGNFLLSEQGLYSCYVSILDPNTQNTLVRKQFPLQVSYVPIAIELLVPWYKDAIFSTQNIKNVEFYVQLNMPPAQLKKLKLETLVRRKGSNVAIETKKISSVAAKNKIMFDAAKLPEGKLEIVARLQDKSGKIKAETVQPFRKLPYKKGEVWRGKDLNWYIDGGKYFMLGCWGREEDYVKELNAILLNHKMTAQPEAITNTHVKKLLAQKNMKILGSLMHIKAEYMPGKYRDKLPEKVINYISEQVKQMSKNPQLFAYYYCDEPEVMGDIESGLRLGYDLISELDPYHPVMISNDTISGIKDFAKTGDINGIHCYPAAVKNKSMYDFEKVMSFMENGVDYFKNKKHKQTIAYLHGGFNYGDYGAVGVRVPTYEELRNQDLLAIIMGSKGLIFFDRFVDHYPEIYIGTPCLLKEEAYLAPAFMAPDANIKVSCSEPKAKFSIKKLNNDYWLFVSNATRKTGNIKFTIPALANKTLRVISEDRKIKINGNSFTDKFTPFQVHVYTTSMKPSGLTTIKAINAKIDKVNAARRKPGNLAFQMFEGDSVTLTASSSRAAKSRRNDTGLWHVTDGVIDIKDNYPGILVWNDATPGKSPDWIELKLAKPASISKVVVYPFEKTLKDYQVQAFVNNQWQTVARVANRQDEVIISKFKPVITNKIRIFVTATNGPRAKIVEIELYK
jgi:Carbohydrate family 9 binding domain-like/NedA-like, galactose-binding domain